MTKKLSGADTVWSDAQGAYVLKNNVQNRQRAAVNSNLPLHEADHTRAGLREASANRSAHKALKRKTHERKMCGFRVSNAEHAQITVALRKLNAANKARGGMLVEFAASDLLRGAVLTLCDEIASDMPDWTGILADVRRAMP